MDNSMYTTLPKGSRTIRLLGVSPGKFLDPIESVLHTAELGACRPYKALSYAWQEQYNDISRSCNIRCNGLDTEISPNLFAALRRVRRRDVTVTLWVDALCINQTSDSERTHQVNMMREIYENSEEVVIWLGEPSTTGLLGNIWLEEQEKLNVYDPNAGVSNHCIEWHGDERDRPKINYYLGVFSEFENIHTIVTPESVDIFGFFCLVYLLSQGTAPAGIRFFTDRYVGHTHWTGRVVRAVWTVMDANWWRRIWVIQETVVGPRARIHYGNVSAPWEMFSKAAETYNLAQYADNLYRTNSDFTRDPLLHFSRVLTGIDSARTAWKRQLPISLLQLLRNFRSREATDARDKVFALIGLDVSRDKSVLPDYRLSAHDVYRNVAVALIRNTRSLSVLSGTLTDNGEQRRWSSWVTDWSVRPPPNEYERLCRLDLYSAARDLHGPVRLHKWSQESWALEVTGYYVGEITEDSSKLPFGQASRARYTAFGWERMAHRVVREPCAFWRTLCADLQIITDPTTPSSNEGQHHYQRADNRGSTSFRIWTAEIQENNRMKSIYGDVWLQTQTESKARNEERTRFHYTVESASGHRTFFVTRKGHIGTGPPSLQIGDRIFVVAGSRVPLILRRSRLNDSHPPCQYGETSVLIPDPTVDIQDITCSHSHAFAYEVVGDAYVHGIMDGEVVQQARRRRIALERLYLV